MCASRKGRQRKGKQCVAKGKAADKNSNSRQKGRSKQKFYCLDMFPYPSTAEIPLAQIPGFIASDVIARMKQMQDFEVLHPIGWDSFGLPTEQEALRTGRDPEEVVLQNIATARAQLKALDLNFTGEGEITTSDPQFYRWTQWIFLKLYNAWFDPKKKIARPIETLPIPNPVRVEGEVAIEAYRDRYRLAYAAEEIVHWCPVLNAVLSNEEVANGHAIRGGYAVERRPMRQWMLRISAYSERLLSELDTLDWPKAVKEQQRSWIGKRSGIEIRLKVHQKDELLDTFLERAEMLPGATFVVISSEHPLLDSLTTSERKTAVAHFIATTRSLDLSERATGTRKQSGVFIGSYALNPLTEELVPIYVGDYALRAFGCLATLGIPAHDERDFEFARTFELEIRPVFAPAVEADGSGAELHRAVVEGEIAYSGGGWMLPLPFLEFRRLRLTGKRTARAAEKILDWLSQQGVGRATVHYKLRDWVFSKQRYWGEPIPIVHWQDGTRSAVSEDELPLKLPRLHTILDNDASDYVSLASAKEWKEVLDLSSGKRGERETSTMPQWAGSCWYYLRFLDPHNTKVPWAKDQEKEWLPIDLYIGSAEHAVLHLFYARFVHQVLFDLGMLQHAEPFRRLVTLGRCVTPVYRDGEEAIIPLEQVTIDQHGVAHHTQRGEVLERQFLALNHPDIGLTSSILVDRYGSDVVRLGLLFLGPIAAQRVIHEQPFVGVDRFLRRIAHYVALTAVQERQRQRQDQRQDRSIAERELGNHAQIDELIGRIGDALDRMAFHTAISHVMELFNVIENEGPHSGGARKFLAVLTPFAPRFCQVQWERLGEITSCMIQRWPGRGEKKIKNKTSRSDPKKVVAVNSKKRTGCTLSQIA
jgi:leucyl-tRNA synthetase